MQDMVLLRQVSLAILYPALFLHISSLLFSFSFTTLFFASSFIHFSHSLLQSIPPWCPFYPPGFSYLLSLVVPVCSESGHTLDHQSDLESVHGSLPTVLATEETQQEDDSQGPEDKNSGRQGATFDRAGSPRSSYEHIFGKCGRSFHSF